MTTPATLQRLIKSAESKVQYLQTRLENVQRKASRTGSMDDLSELAIAEAQLDRARGHLNSLKMQGRYEKRFAELVTEVKTH